MPANSRRSIANDGPMDGIGEKHRGGTENFTEGPRVARQCAFRLRLNQA